MGLVFRGFRFIRLQAQIVDQRTQIQDFLFIRFFRCRPPGFCFFRIWHVSRIGGLGWGLVWRLRSGLRLEEGVQVREVEFIFPRIAVMHLRPLLCVGMKLGRRGLGFMSCPRHLSPGLIRAGERCRDRKSGFIFRHLSLVHALWGRGHHPFQVQGLFGLGPVLPTPGAGREVVKTGIFTMNAVHSFQPCPFILKSYSNKRL